MDYIYFLLAVCFAMFLVLIWFVRKGFVRVRAREAVIVQNRYDDRVLRAVEGPRRIRVNPFSHVCTRYPLIFHSIRHNVKDIATIDNLAVEAQINMGFYFHPERVNIDLLGDLLPYLHALDDMTKNEIEKSLREFALNYHANDIIGNPAVRRNLDQLVKRDFLAAVSRFGFVIQEIRILFHTTPSMHKANLEAENRRLILGMMNNFFNFQDPISQITVGAALEQIFTGKAHVMTNLNTSVNTQRGGQVINGWPVTQR